MTEAMTEAVTEALTLTQTRIRSGIWEALLTGVKAGAPPPALSVTLHEQPLSDISLVPVPGESGAFALQVPIPAELISEGVQTFVICEKDRPGAPVLAHFTLITGGAAEADLRAELDLLRSELELLKSAFRHHCRQAAFPAPEESGPKAKPGG